MLLTSLGVSGDKEQTAESLTPAATACLALMGCACPGVSFFIGSIIVEKILTIPGPEAFF